jgi:signal transduction histidine kinase
MTYFVYLTFYSLIWLCNDVFGGMFTTTAYFMGIFIAPFFVFTFYFLDRNIKLIADKYFFIGIRNQQEAMDKLAEGLTDYTDINKIIALIENTIKEIARTNEIKIFLLTPENEYKTLDNKNTFEDSFLIDHMTTTQKILVKEEILVMSKNSIHEEEKIKLLKIYKHVKETDASLYIPLIANKNLIGIMALSSKVSTDPYTEEDLNLLSNLSKQTSIAIENSRQYKEINDFGKVLQKKVEEQTREIKEKNKHLKELLNIKSEFLKIASHQLNTPLSIMRGYISMLKDKDCNQEKALPIVETALRRIIKTVSILFDAYNLEGEKMKLNTSVVNINKLINKIIKEKRELISSERKTLKITTKKPDFDLPDLWCDEERITYVISSLLDNSIFYSSKGKINILYEKNEKYLKIKIEDSGSGISMEDSEIIFHKFSRGVNAPNIHQDGSGISLYISKKIIEGHKGKISFENKKNAQGAIFTFTLPIYIPN